MMTKAAYVDGSSAPEVRPFLGPLEALQRIVAVDQARLESRRTELAELRHAVLRLSGQVGSHAEGDRPAWEVLGAELAAPVVRQLAEKAQVMIRRSVVSTPARIERDEVDVRNAQALLRQRTIRQQTLYPVDVLDTEPGRAWVAGWADAGEEQRVSLGPPSDFAIFDDEAVLAVAQWGNPAADHVLIRDAMLVAAFTALFDRAFTQALPVFRQVEPGEGGEGDLRLVRLLGLGLKDESIARYLGCSLRTVRRRVAHLMEIHGAQTRFQLGAAVARADAVALTGQADR